MYDSALIYEIIIFCLFLVDGKTVSTFEEKKDLTLPAREKPEKSVRLMREQGMLRKYWYFHYLLNYIPVEKKNCQSNYLILILPPIYNGDTKGQLISEWLFGVFNFQKKKTQNVYEYLPYNLKSG